MRMPIEILDSSLAFWNDLQPVVQGAIVALLGVCFTLTVGVYTSGRQLKHDRRQKSLEREFSLKKETMSEFSDGACSAKMHLATLGTIEIDKVSKGLNEFQKASQRVRMIFSAEVLGWLGQYERLIVEEQHNALPLIGELNLIRKKISYWQKLWDDEHASFQRTVSELRVLKAQGQEAALIKSAEQRIESLRLAMDQYTVEMKNEGDVRLTVVQRMMDRSEAMFPKFELVEPALFTAMKRDLGLPFNVKKYEAACRAAWKDSADLMRESRKRLFTNPT